MTIHELRNLEEARKFLLQSLWLQRVLAPTPNTVRPVLEWALEVASSGHPLPPIGFVADLGHVAFGLDQEAKGARDALAIPGFPAGLARTYEDHVLGKIYADWSFDRASDALRRYQGRDRARGLAFVLDQIRQRGQFGGVLLSPAVVKALLEGAPEDALNQGWESLARGELLPWIPELYEALIAAARHLADVLATEDIFELEHRTALVELGQRVALRQVLHAAARLEAALPRHRLRPLTGRQEVPTRVLDEDTYPVGGYSSVANRGSIESLLHSQLAYMEPQKRPDLFDIKFLRDELLYYARDENQFLRRRRTFVLALFPDLIHCRFKDPSLPCQRIVLVLALAVAAVHKLSEWLNTDSLLFEFLFPDENDPPSLEQERDLLTMLLREPIANGTVRVERLAGVAALPVHCTLRARRSLCHCLLLSAGATTLPIDDAMVTRLQVDGPSPTLTLVRELPTVAEADDPMESWSMALERLLQVWV